jgi:predicted phage gp36 major capsid-like protein
MNITIPKKLIITKKADMELVGLLMSLDKPEGLAASNLSDTQHKTLNTLAQLGLVESKEVETAVAAEAQKKIKAWEEDYKASTAEILETLKKQKKFDTPNQKLSDDLTRLSKLAAGQVRTEHWSGYTYVHQPSKKEKRAFLTAKGKEFIAGVEVQIVG